MESINAITFDVGGTLIEPWPSVGAAYAEVARAHGVGADPDLLNIRFAKAWQRDREFNYTQAAWAGLVDEVFAGLCEQSPSETFFDDLYERFGQPETWRIYEDVLPTLHALRERGLRLAVLSNWDDRLRTLLGRLGLSRWFEALFISAELGCQKPDPKIFQLVSSHLNLPPHRILHIGDSQREDFEGATAAGWQARCLQRTPCSESSSGMGSLAALL